MVVVAIGEDRPTVKSMTEFIYVSAARTRTLGGGTILANQSRPFRGMSHLPTTHILDEECSETFRTVGKPSVPRPNWKKHFVTGPKLN